MTEMTPDEEWRATDGRHPQAREMDSLSSQMSEMIDGLGKANKGIEGAKKNLSGVWGVVAAAVAGVWFLSQFVASYQSAMSNGSPAMLQMKGELQTSIASIKKTDDDRYDTLNAILVQLKANNEMMERRLSRLEDRDKR